MLRSLGIRRSRRHLAAAQKASVSHDSSRYCQESNKTGWLDDALKSAEFMQQQGLGISRDIAYHLVQECTKQQTLEHGSRVQSLMIHNGLDSVSALSDHLVRLFLGSRCLVAANQAFSKVLGPSQYTWNAIIDGNAKLAEGDLALQLYHNMSHESAKPDNCTFLGILRACGTIHHGRHIHEQIVEKGIQSDVAVGSTLVDMYAKCGNLREAHRVFDILVNRNVVTWGALIAGYTQHGKGHLALKCFEDMQCEGIDPSRVTFLSILKACGATGAIEQGRYIHKKIIENYLQSDLVLGSTLVDMYAKCGSLEEAYKVFSQLPNRNVVVWNAMISGYAYHGEGELAMKCFQSMQHDGISPDKATFLSVLKASSSISALVQARRIHNQILENGFQSDIIVGSTLVDTYAKCGDLEEASRIFDKLLVRDLVVWSAMIAAYVQHSEGFLALRCFDRMLEEGVKPDKFTFSSALKACSSIGALERGKNIHEKIIENGFQAEIVVESALVDMYAKCGGMDEASKIFSNLQNRDVMTWSAMITGYSQRGKVRLAGQYLETMQQDGLSPDEVTFATILAACSHAGLVNEGHKFFKSMKDHSIMPDVRHYNCMVDLLSRAGHLKEAEFLLQILEPTFNGWTSLLSGCKTYGNVEIGKRCFDQVVQLDAHHSSCYVLMSGIYTDAHMWKEAAAVEELRQQAGAHKKPGKAWIEVNNEIHEFIVGDKGHAQSDEIYAMLKTLGKRMKDAGYMPKVDMVLHQMSDQEKEDALCGHCEKLAIAFGIVSTPPGTIIRATKNLRVCMDCHDATKIISKLENREIIIKDTYRIHHFKDGFCSCGDYH